MGSVDAAKGTICRAALKLLLLLLRVALVRALLTLSLSLTLPFPRAPFPPQFQPLSGLFFGSSLYPQRANVSFYFQFASPRMGENDAGGCAGGGSFDNTLGFCICPTNQYMTPAEKVSRSGVVNLTEVVKASAGPAHRPNLRSIVAESSPLAVALQASYRVSL